MDPLEGETLTFLLEDIEGSASRWDRADAAMASALERHDELLRSVVAARGGRWVKHMGDGALVAFPSALGAISAAADVQRAIAGEEWKDVGGLRVRIALHSGEARRRDGDYFGQALNRTARLLEAAHGGQVLVSLVTEELVRDRLPSDLGLRDLGSHSLPDLSRPERIFQLELDGLAATFPPLRGSRDAHVALPAFRTSFVGRDADLPVVAKALVEHRLVTLTGVGGSGKTRLAVEVGHNLSDRFPDGIYFVDLATIADGELVTRQTARAMNVLNPGQVSGSAGPIREQLLGAVGDMETLIILDNCEHLLGAAADHVDDLLAASPQLRVLATSREPLAVEGEQVLPVTSLALPTSERVEDAASLRLLLDRVREVVPTFRVRSEDRGPLIEICRRLDGLPLALELAAARLTHLSPQDLASRLDDRFRLLSGGRRQTERQQTLRAAIDWSYDLLDETEQAGLRRLSVFAGGAPLTAITAVALTDSDEATAIDVVGRLVSRSLVVMDTTAGDTRYRLLETVRLYGEEKLVTAGEAEAFRGRHRDWYLAWLESFPWDLRLVSPAVATEVQAEYDNLRLAVQWSATQYRPDLVARFIIGLTGFAIFNGYVDELDRWQASAPPDGLQTRLAAALEMHNVSLDLWRYAGDPATFDALRVRADRAYNALAEGDPYRASARFAYAVSYSSRPKEARRMEEAAKEALQLAAAADAPWMQPAAMSFQAKARLYQDDPESAVAILRAAMDLPGWAVEHDGHNIRHDLAVSLHLLGHQDEALSHALDVTKQSSLTWRHIGLFDAALITAAQGKLPEAWRYIRRSLEHLERTRWQHPMALSDCTIILAAIASFEHRWQDASRLLAISQGNSSHPTLFAVWVRYRNKVRETLPKDVRSRCIQQGRQLDPAEAIHGELAKS